MKKYKDSPNFLKKFSIYSVSIITCLLAFSILTGVINNPFSKKVEAEGEIEINYLQDLYSVRDDLSGSYILMNDLDFNSDASYDSSDPDWATKKTSWTTGTGWTPIGDSTTNFSGIFDGNGYTISNLYINRPTESNIGLFGMTSSYSTILGTQLLNVNVTGDSKVGALIGDNSGMVAGSYSTGSVEGSGTVGGLIGNSTPAGLISSSYSSANVTSTGDNIGGLVGQLFYGTLESSYSSGTVNGGNQVGGLIGRNFGGDVSNCYSESSVTGTDQTGGLVGYNGSATVDKSYSVGPVTCAGSSKGGLIGANSSSTTTNSFWNTETSTLGTSYGGTGKTTVQMRAIETYNDPVGTDGLNEAWDILPSTDPGFSMWTIVDTVSYPTLVGAGLSLSDAFSQDTGYYLIENFEDLETMVSFFLPYSSAKYRLTADIDLTIEPGFYIPYFRAEFDGNGHTISNIVINQPSTQYVGFIARTQPGAVIKNLGLVNIDITGNTYVGGIAGDMDNGQIINSYTTGTVAGSDWLGGLVGETYNGSSISESYSSVTITSPGSWYVGGLVANNEGGTISDSFFTGSLEGDGYIGGLVGDNDAGPISNSYSTGSITGTGDAIGGLVGLFSTGETISNSYATGAVSSGASSWNVGGLVGEGYDVVIEKSYATGNVTGDDYVGGLVGFGDNNIISNSYATGDVSEVSTGSQDGDSIGGFIGYASGGTINNCYSVGAVSAYVDSYVGGFVGDGEGSGAVITNSFWDTDTSTKSTSDGATGKTTIQMMDISTFNDTATDGLDVAWDIVTLQNFDPETPNTWFIKDGEEYPKLDNNYVPPTEIRYLQDLDDVRNDLTASYVLMNDLDFNSDASYDSSDPDWATKKNSWTTGTGWVPIGDSTVPFTGVIDGNGFEISNLYINVPSGEELGLIGRLDSQAEVKNLGLTNIDITGSYYIGGLVGRIPFGGGGTFTNVYTTGSITDTDGSVGGIIGQCGSTTISDSYSTVTINGGEYDVGGLVGYMEETTISNSHYSGTISPSVGDPYSGNIGGLVGLADYLSLITDSYSTGSITGYAGIGGLAGWCEDTIIRDSYSTATITGYQYVGGLVGEYRVSTETSILEDSYATGNISGYDPDGYSSLEIGGLVGYNYRSIIRRSFATGNVIGDDYVGGLIGDSRKGIISNSYATGDVSEQADYYEDGYYIGGFIGYSRDDEINNCYSVGLVTTFAPVAVGGFMGLNYSTSSLVTNSFWDSETSTMSTSDGGTDKTTSQMKSISNYNNTDTEGLDVAWSISLMTTFDPLIPSIWYIDDGNDYPKLSYQYIAPEDPPVEEDIDPEVSTSNPINITTTSATLNATLTNLGTYDTVFVYFRHRILGSTAWVESSQVAKALTGSYSLDLMSLTPDTQYEFSAAVSFGDTEVAYGDILSFTTNASTTEPPEETPEEPSEEEEPIEDEETPEEPPEEDETPEETSEEPEKDCTTADESITVNVGDTFKVSITYGSGLPYRPYAPIYDSEVLDLLEQEDIAYEQPSSPNDALSPTTIGGAMQRVYTFEAKNTSLDTCTLVKLGLSHTHDGDDIRDEKTIAVFISEDTTEQTPPDDGTDTEEDTTTPDEEPKENIFKRVGTGLKNLIEKAVKTISTVNLDRATANTVEAIGYSAATASYVLLNFVTFTGTNSVSTLQLLSSFFMIGALKKKKNQKYGIVYDSVTKEPINMATVRVFDSSGKLVTTVVTDVYGIFDLNLDQGQYRLEVVSRDHTFPSKAVLGSNDEPYQNVYKGELINYTPNQPLNISIPMDKEDKGFIAKSLASSRSMFLAVLNLILKALFVVGFGMTVVSVIKEPTTFSWILLLMYIASILLLIYLNIKESKSYGKVTYVDGSVVEGIEIGLRELQFDTLYAKRVTDENGKYRFILPNGKYRLESLDDRYVFVNLKENTFEVGEAKLYILNKDIVVKKVK